MSQMPGKGDGSDIEMTEFAPHPRTLGEFIEAALARIDAQQQPKSKRKPDVRKKEPCSESSPSLQS